MQWTAPTTTSLPDLEQRLEACLLELEKLELTRPSLPTALARAEAGQRIDDLLDEIVELQQKIDDSPVESLEDAAVGRTVTLPELGFTLRISTKDSGRKFARLK